MKLAIDGTIVMSQSLREALDAMYDARIPEKWQKVYRTCMIIVNAISEFINPYCYSDIMGICYFGLLVYRIIRERYAI